MLLIGKISGQVTEQTFEIKGNVSCKVYFRFSQFCAAFLFPVSCTRFTFIENHLTHAILNDESKSRARAAKNHFEPP